MKQMKTLAVAADTVFAGLYGDTPQMYNVQIRPLYPHDPYTRKYSGI